MNQEWGMVNLGAQPLISLAKSMLKMPKETSLITHHLRDQAGATRGSLQTPLGLNLGVDKKSKHDPEDSAF